MANKSTLGALGKLAAKFNAPKTDQEETNVGKQVASGAAKVLVSSGELIKWGSIALALVVAIVLAGGAVNGAGTAISSAAGSGCNNSGANTKAISDAEGMGFTVSDDVKTQSKADYGNACKTGVGYTSQTYPPTTGIITTFFARVDDLHPNGHNGLDIAGACGTPIYAFAGGEVTTVVAGSESKSTSGNYVFPAGKVIIKHTDEFSSMYYHLQGSTTTVKVGDIVNAGDQIATQWSNGQSTGCHLHLEMYENGTRIDANEVLAAAGYIYSDTAQFTAAMLPPKPDAENATTVSYTSGSAKQIALNQVLAKGWPQTEFTNCLVPLWERESGWRVNALNPNFAPSKPPAPDFQAYGIVQAAPGSKMATAGADWRTNPATQVSWGISYIESRYGTPCAAWAHSESVNWY